MPARAAVACLVLIGVCAHADAPTNPTYDALGPIEKQVVDRTLKDAGLELVANPSGKRVGAIRVKNHEVFSDDEWKWLTWFNLFHRTTRDDIVAREVLLQPGELWDPKRVDETVRNLRSPVHTSVVVVLPVRAPETKDGEVDVLVVTRDVWSLRLNTNFQFQQDTLTVLQISLAENNLAGWRKLLSFAFAMDQGTIAFGPRYRDPNIAGTHLVLDTSFNTIFARDGSGFEGTSSKTTFSYPLWSLSQKWGASLEVTHFDGTARLYRGTGVASYDVPETVTRERLPWQYHWRIVDVIANVVRSYGREVKLDVHAGYEFYLTRPELSADFEGDTVARQAFSDDILPRSERSSLLYTRFHVYTPTYGTYRDFGTFDLREDFILGPDLDLVFNTAMQWLGSEANYLKATLDLSWSFDFGRESYLKLALGWRGRVDRTGLADHRVVGSLYAVSPKLWNVFRVFLTCDIQTRLAEQSNGFYLLGGDTGLRGYEIGAFKGLVSVLTHLELRTMPLKLWFWRLGGVVFWDMGHAADRFGDLVMHHDLGVGIRWLTPQINTLVFRFDWAFATQGSTAGWPGRISFGFQQAF